VTEEEWKQMLAYSAAVFQNCGNFKSFGDTKFVPELSPESFRKIVSSSKAYKTHSLVMDAILGRIWNEIFCEEKPLARIGFPDEEG
jgi:dipeptidyl-peptidase III